MGFLLKFERKIETLVGDGLARVFGGKVQLQEVTFALRQQARLGTIQVADGSFISPYHYDVFISSEDRSGVLEKTNTSLYLASDLKEFIEGNGWVTSDPICVFLKPTMQLHSGQFRVKAQDVPVDQSLSSRPAKHTTVEKVEKRVVHSYPHEKNNNKVLLKSHSGHTPALVSQHVPGYPEPHLSDEELFHQRHAKNVRYDNYEDENSATATSMVSRNSADTLDRSSNYSNNAKTIGRKNIDPEIAADSPTRTSAHGSSTRSTTFDDVHYNTVSTTAEPTNLTINPLIKPAESQQSPSSALSSHSVDAISPASRVVPPKTIGSTSYANVAAPVENITSAKESPFISPTNDADEYAYNGISTVSEPIISEPKHSNNANIPVQTAHSSQLGMYLKTNPEKKYIFKDGENIIGRGQESDFQVPDSGVSRKHFKIVLAEDKATLIDLGSTNGTSVNGLTVQTRTLHDGDVIKVGHTDIVIKLYS